MGTAALPRDGGERTAAMLVALAASATIAGALASQYVFGLVPCKLCVLERWPYYVGVPLALVVAAMPARWHGWRRGGLILVGFVFLASAVLAIYHSGVEWHWWKGPSDCGGGVGTPASVDGLLKSLETIKVVNCEEAAWRGLGLSLAGWNALVSLALAALAFGAALRSEVAPRGADPAIPSLKHGRVSGPARPRAGEPLGPCRR